MKSPAFLERFDCRGGWPHRTPLFRRLVAEVQHAGHCRDRHGPLLERSAV